MGIRGLQSFLSYNKQHLAKEVQLSNSSLVIDANNLMCMLYRKSCLDDTSEHYRNDIYGGDLVNYAKEIKEFFTSLKECKITPILVFDGAVIGEPALKDFVASKENVVYKRNLERFKRAQAASEFPTDDELLLPQTINTVFRSVTNEMGAQRIQTPYEADAHIARVANELNCPVLTNDSDFIIYDLEQGFLMLDFFEYKTPEANSAGQTCIKCLSFSQANMAKFLPGLKPEVMPLLSVLLGNDYVEAGTFDGELRSIRERYKSDPLKTRSFNHWQIASLLSWLRGSSLQESVDCILSWAQSKKSFKLNSLIKIFLRNYRIEAIDDFDMELEQIYPSDEVDQRFAELGQTPVAFLRKHLEQSDLSPIVLGLIFSDTFYNYIEVNHPDLPSSNCVKNRPYSLALALLRPKSLVDLTTQEREQLIARTVLQVYDRVDDEYKKSPLRQMEKLDSFGSLLHLDCYSMIALEPALKRHILLDCFRSGPDELRAITLKVARIVSGPFIQDAAICFTLVKYIALETKVKPKAEFLNALFLTIFYYAAVSGNLAKERIVNDAACEGLLHELRPYTQSRHNVSKNHEFYLETMHSINQLHSTFEAYTLVNSLLDHPLQQTRIERFLNSTLIFRLTKLLSVEEINLPDLFKELPTHIHDLIFKEVCL